MMFYYEVCNINRMKYFILMKLFGVLIFLNNYTINLYDNKNCADLNIYILF